jgi:signal peptidase II
MNNETEDRRKRSIIIYSIIAVIVVLDQITKYIVKSSMHLYESINLLGDFLKFTYIENPGMAFGIQFENKFWFTVLSVVAAGIVVFYLLRMTNERYIFRFSLALILGGAIGNLIDRLAFGKVVDFIDVEFIDITLPSFNFWIISFPGYDMTRWPVFNIADSAVTCGMILLTWMVLTQKPQLEQEIVSEGDKPAA